MRDLRQVNAALANAVLDAFNAFLVKGNAEGFLDVRGRTSELNGAANGRAGIGFDLEVELFGEGGDEFERCRVGGVARFVLCAAETDRTVGAAGTIVDLQRFLPLDDDGNGDLRLGWGCFDGNGICGGGLLTALEDDARLVGKTRGRDAGGISHS